MPAIFFNISGRSCRSSSCSRAPCYPGGEGLAGISLGKDSKSKKTEDFSLKNFSDSIIYNLKDLKKDIIYCITGDLYQKLSDAKIVDKKDAFKGRDSNNDFLVNKTYDEIIGRDHKSGLGLANDLLLNIGYDGVYGVLDALYDYNKHIDSAVSQTKATKKFDEDNSVLGLMSKHGSGNNAIESIGGKKDSKNDVLASAVNTFLVIVDDLDAGRKKV